VDQNFITRRFIILARKLRDDVHKARETIHSDLANLANGLSNLKDAVNEHWEADKRSGETELPVTISNPRTEIPIRIQTETKRSCIEWVWQIIKGTLEIGGFAAVIVYAVTTYCQWRDLRHNFIVDERAWVGIDIQLSAIKNPDGTIKFVANGVFKNTGKTPALKMSSPHSIVTIKAWNDAIDQDREWIDGMESLKLAEDAGRQTVEANKNANPQFMADFGAALANQREKWHGEGGALAPNSTSQVNLANDTRANPSLKNGQPQIVYWIGRFTYYDIFGKEQHTTKFCS
jgi:hypothetical protein